MRPVRAAAVLAVLAAGAPAAPAAAQGGRAAQRLIDPCRTSPAANTPGMLVSR